ncbi:P-loop containing nucleoside triphosphate hydrolase protein [Collybia nuda]|uniref:P-loop containing nucleoside triphosphate hydrolase protein n=1 Tax=Collybia nuda TaxID=64659 RepID=A0A9P5XXF8_9AGAR|nr:P-loop containing nucleoside triphosphate hydrolase protein [Collybia nuda]
MDSITQLLLPKPAYPETIKVRCFSRSQAGNAADLAKATGEPYFGLSVTLATSGEVGLIAVATSQEVFLLSVGANKGPPLLNEQFKDLLSGASSSTLIGFEMARLAIQINRDLGTPVCGIDLGTLFSGTRNPWNPGELITNKVCPQAKSSNVNSIWGSGFDGDEETVCLRAWISACAAESLGAELSKALKVETEFLNTKELDCLGNLIKQADLLEAAKPKEVPNEFTTHKMCKDGTLLIINARYRTRIRKGNQAGYDKTTVIMKDENGREFTGRARNPVGKRTGIKLTGPKFSGTLASVRVVGRQDLTNAEKACNEILLLFLQKKKIIRDSFFIRMLWFPSGKQPVKVKAGNTEALPTSIPLNNSQQEAVQAMVSDSPLVIVHGPPGTGKTTTISAAASIWEKSRQSAWIVAHSNVAVKNIAEKLVKHGIEFKLLVSKEFYFEWHEHIYTLIGKSLIRIDTLPTKMADTKKVIGSSCIVLSTLSTLSNPTLVKNGLFKLVPVDRLVIDEASQIKVFDFMSVFVQFSNLKKICFFGDPKQHSLPADRMPVPLGDFISKNVYNGRLQSKHAVTHASCIAFINVTEGGEKKGGFSWKNFAEIKTIVHLVRNYYRHRDFCVITPYDAQRAAIEKALKDEKLPWERVFNVDSFQGNEAKYVLISVVRSGRPGFLTSLNRMNVMLTRCQAGLVIVTSRFFLRGGGQDTLLGKLAKHWEQGRGDGAWVEWRSVASEEVDLPGAPGRNRTVNASNIVQPPAVHLVRNPPPSQIPFVAPTYSHEAYGPNNPPLLLQEISRPKPQVVNRVKSSPARRPVRPWTAISYDKDFPTL